MKIMQIKCQISLATFTSIRVIAISYIQWRIIELAQKVNNTDRHFDIFTASEFLISEASEIIVSDVISSHLYCEYTLTNMPANRYIYNSIVVHIHACEWLFNLGNGSFCSTIGWSVSEISKSGTYHVYSIVTYHSTSAPPLLRNRPRYPNRGSRQKISSKENLILPLTLPLSAVILVSIC